MRLLYQVSYKIKEFISGGLLHIFSSSIINKILSFLSNFVVVRVISKEEYGEYTIILNIFSFFMLLDGLGLVSAVMQKCSEKESDDMRRKVFEYGVSFAFFFNIMISCIIVVYANISGRFSAQSKLLLCLLSITMPLNLLYEMQQIYLRYNRKNKEYSYLTTLNSIFVVSLSILGALKFTTLGLVIARILASVFTVITGVVIFKAKLTIIPKDSLKQAEKKDLKRLGVISLINIATGQLLYLIDIYVVGIVVRDELVIAEYKVATIIPDALLFIPAALMIYYCPIFIENRENKEWTRKSYKKLTVIYGVLNLIMTCLIIVLAPLILRIVFGEQYVENTCIFRILMVAYFFSSTFRKINGNLLAVLRKLKANLYIGIYEGIVNIALNFMLVSHFGATGAAVATLLVAITSACISTIYLNNTIKRGYSIVK